MTDVLIHSPFSRQASQGNSVTADRLEQILTEIPGIDGRTIAKCWRRGAHDVSKTALRVDVEVVGLPIAEYAPRSVKLAITGNGGSTKEQVRFMIMRILGLKKEPPLDMSDALAVALAHKGRNVMRMKS